jgi:hypothetical protein
MNWTSYIVPSALLRETPPKECWHAYPIPADLTQSLVFVQWGNMNLELEFERLDGVLHLGYPWETPPAEALPLLASFPQSVAESALKESSPIGELPPTDSLARCLRGLDCARGFLR